MKVIYLHQYFNTPDMSGSTRSYEMARRLVAMGHEVEMVSSIRSEDASGSWSCSNVDGINVHWYPVPYSNRMSYPERIRAFFRFASAATLRAIRMKGDVVFATSTPLTIAIPGVVVSRKNRIPMVFEVRDLWPELPIAMGALRNPAAIATARWLERFAYRNSAHVVALSPGMRDGVAAAGFPLEKISVIPNSADLNMFAPDVHANLAFRSRMGLPPDRTLVVYAGTFGAINGVGYLARVAASSLRKGYDLTFAAIGEGAEYEQVKGEADALGVLGRNMWIMPSVPKRSIPEVFAAADIACSLVIDLPALQANSANKFFDALASGTPVAINHGGWQAELLTKHEAGLVLPPGDPDAASDLLAELASNRDRLRSMGIAARRLAISEFSRDELARQLERVLREAATSGKLRTSRAGEY